MAASYGHGSRPSAHMYQGEQSPWGPQQHQSYDWQNSYNPTAAAAAPPPPSPPPAQFYNPETLPAFNGQQGVFDDSQQGSPYGQSLFGSGQMYPPPPPPPQRPLFSPHTDPEIVREFTRADVNHNGTIEAAELGQMLSTQDPPFSDRTVRLMLHLFADNRDDTSRIGPAGFMLLWKELKLWQSIFERYDTNQSWTIELEELKDAIRSIGYSVSAPVLQLLMSKYDFTGQNRSITYDNFIECGLVVKGLSEKFKEQDGRDSGFASFSYEDFMLTVLAFV